MTSDSQLLARYADAGCDEAFAELVRRHVNLVYSAALRQVGGEAHLAQDVAQTVFSDLARKASSLARRPNLTGWLYTSARFAAAKIARTEQRRRSREEQFMREPNQAAPEPDWEKLRPVLDEVMHELKETDREVILLRYFENQAFAEIGARCGVNENAARMRVERAVEKLRGMLAKRGVTTAIELASVLSVHAVETAPAGLAATLASNSLAGAGAGSAAFWNVLNATKVKLGFGVLAVTGAAMALIVQNQARANLIAANETLEQRIAQLKTDNEGLSNRPLKRPAPATEQLDELLRLRGEAGMLREQTNEGARLREENRKLHSQAAAKSAIYLSEDDQFTLRQAHALDGMNHVLDAVKDYAASHGGKYPAQIEQLGNFGILGTSAWSGHLTLNDFEILKPGMTDMGHKVVAGLRNAIPRPGRASVMIWGGFDDDGLPFTAVLNYGLPDP
jgi:RNA polymerase sigma factor (sigma-70 family)